MQKPLPIGVENFADMIEKKYYYIDKTLCIKEILDKRVKVLLFTRPRRFGKTLNLSMLQHFFEKKEENSSYLFEGLNIMNAGEKYTSHMGQYPVINLSLKSAKQLTYESAMNKLKEELQSEFRRHSYLLNSEILLESNYKKFQRFLNEEASQDEYSGSLKFLSECLECYHGKKVIVLIDEYDVPLEASHFNGFYDKMVDFIRTLMESVLKTNSSLEFAVLTGCLRISKESIFTGLNNLNIVSILSSSYSEHFGFTVPEVKELLSYYQLEGKEHIVKKWYNGYMFGKSNIYNPWSIVNYLAEVSYDESTFPRPYWSNTSSNSIIRNLIDKAKVTEKEEIEMLIQGGTVTKPIHEDITYEDIEKSMNNLWNFLFFTGYLKKVREEQKERQLYLTLEIPNQEILYIFETKIKEWIQEVVQTGDNSSLYHSIIKGDTKLFEEELNKLLGRSISYMDSYENFYHGFLAGLLLGIEDYSVKSNRESGNGRGDIFLKCAINTNIAVIIELKMADSYKSLEKYCDIALTQIKEQKYEEDLRDEGYKSILKYGIAFYKKRCEIKLDNDR